MSEVLGIGLPSGWAAAPLKHVTSVLNRGSGPNYVDDGPVRAISQAANQAGGLDWSRTRFHDFAGDPLSLKGALHPGDVLINSTGTGTLGRVGYFTGAPDEIPCMADSHVTVARAEANQLDSRFVYYWLSSMPFYHYIYAALVVGATNQIELNRDRLGDAPVPLPPLEEQRRIADFLDAETSRIDRIVFAKEKASASIDERRVSLISQLCLRGLGGEYSLRDSGVGPLGPVPEHWTVTRNKNFLREIVDLSEGGEEELLTVSHLTGVTPRSEKNVFMFKAESMVGYKICRPGDLVINTLWAWMGALGVSSHEGIVSPAYGVYRFTSQDMVPEYFDLLYRTPEYVCEMTRYSKGVWTSRLRLYPESFLALSAPVPPRDEQAEIVRTVEREVQPGARLQNAIRRSNALLTERRQALIAAAVTGQFDVSTASGRNVTEGITA
ncbi:restriction endonuclease subunit S [Streptomyces sp. NPDC048018]|uniref:restriction endonuclease subunit S n=1 Tax=Streptomyces sp. NPDC048018 TaxID=3365499 RepID=UPI0037179279